ncbi:uncharacterized protein TNCV_721901 [Trichonephila clavipes]|nr:uncharacterized protein TNCV_721901 [Trichonephila clavipes]
MILYLAHNRALLHPKFFGMQYSDLDSVCEGSIYLSLFFFLNIPHNCVCVKNCTPSSTASFSSAVKELKDFFFVEAISGTKTRTKKEWIAFVDDIQNKNIAVNPTFANKEEEVKNYYNKLEEAMHISPVHSDHST